MVGLGNVALVRWRCPDEVLAVLFEFVAASDPCLPASRAVCPDASVGLAAALLGARPDEAEPLTFLGADQIGVDGGSEAGIVQLQAEVVVALA